MSGRAWYPVWHQDTASQRDCAERDPMSLRPSLALAGVVTAIGGVALIGILPKFGVAQPIPVGVAVIGCGLALLGLDGIITGVVTEGQGQVGRITYYGLGARLRGTMTFLLGGI